MSTRVSLSKCGLVGFAAAALLILNLVDAIFTIGWLEVGVAEEANPVMDLLISGSPLAFMMVKLTLVSLCVGLLWRLQHHRGAIGALVAGAGGYAILAAYHLSAVPAVASYVASR